MYLERIVLALSNFFGFTENMLRFRKTTMRAMIDAGLIPQTSVSYGKLIREISKARDNAHSTLLGDIAFIVGILSLFANIRALGYLGIGLSIMMVLRSVTVGILAFHPPERRRPQTELEFMRRWNKGPVRKWTAAIYFPVVALAMGISEKGFQIGMRIIQEYAMSISKNK